jgi:protein-S-isoprenylcysteine O-methyltransferase Ste14
VYWLAMSFTAKDTVERRGGVWYRLAPVIAVAGWLLVKPLASSHSQLWRTNVALGVATDCIFIIGAAFTVWARITLGRNWSADVAFKRDHELIETGPYAIVRHPIYTGLIAMALATAVNYGHVLGFVLFGLLCVSFLLKARQEEKLMAAHFPDAYAEYRGRVHALIPFVL